MDYTTLAGDIKQWGKDIGFQEVGISDCNLSGAETRLLEWLGRGWHGDMDYMAKHGFKRSRPAELVPGTLRIISARIDYLPRGARDSWETLGDPSRAFLSRYALGRDYHTVLRQRLRRLVDRISAAVGDFRYRVFTDSAPVMEVELARKAGLGWRGKHTLLLSREAGSFFFIGEIYTDLALPVDRAAAEHCGTCRKCLDVCPTGAIVAPYQLDARQCISYLTIEHRGSIPEELRPLIGNRVYGCDDCQLVCPWNKFARVSDEADFALRHGLDDAALIDLFSWDQAEFDEKFAGSAVHRIGHERWLRNLAVAMGNALARCRDSTAGAPMIAALMNRRDHPSGLIREHVAWALAQQPGKSAAANRRK